MKAYADEPVAYWQQDGCLQKGAPEDFFPLWNKEKQVISLVGGGGKTTLLYYLAECFCKRGKRTAVMTTTKMGCPERCCTTMAECLACWEAGEYAVCGSKQADGKFRAPDGHVQKQLLEQADALIIEADGARRLPCKVPAEHEPVILPETDVVISVMGLDAADQPVEKVCLRADKVQKLLGCDGQHRLTCEDMARILLSPQGGKKGVEERTYLVVLNKCDDEQRLGHGLALLQELRKQGQEMAVLTGGMRRSEMFEMRTNES